MKTLKEQTIKSVFSKAYQLPVRDDDGSVVWKKEYEETFPMERREPKMMEATTISIIKHIINSMPREVQAPKDGFHSYNLMTQLQVADGKIELKDEQYAWLHRVIKNRKMPFPKEQKEAGAQQLTYGRWLFGLSDYAIAVQLTDVDSTPEEPKEE